jgi:pSer/pThr/pTyr-binding forkhead associated (FHA) protein
MVFICDCGSTHGTFVNDAKLVTNVDSPLFSGDIIRFGVSVDRGHGKLSISVFSIVVEYGN